MTALLLCSCGHSDNFRVTGAIRDGAAINLRFIYYANGGVYSGLTASVDGLFEFEGHSADPAAVEVYDNDYRLLARFTAANGEDIDLTIDRTNIYRQKAGGNRTNKELTEFYNANADALAKGDTPERNKLIAEYVAAHPESPASQLLLATEFDASSAEASAQANELLGLLAPEARIYELAEPFAKLNAQVGSEASREPIAAIAYKAPGNRTETFVAQRQKFAVIAVSDANHGRDSVVDGLRKLAEHEKEGRFAILDLSVDADTITWRRSVDKDSASWAQGWAAGAISGQALDRLGIPRVPYFILVDSAGNQLWRGPGAKEAVKHYEEHSEKE